MLGEQDGYIYGYLFRSSLKGGAFVIDIGDKEYRIFDLVEVWDGEVFIEKDVITIDYSEVVGAKGRLRKIQST
ncbi:hypothetical protein J6TS7_59660 [Paenibacillus dendritiformis]|uniref:hypothetical protein n=1 Tax=Paenibacillus TaxID=44249 RepID=UPI001B00063C|nr:MULTISPECIES: hypothetical protein [Paenibacillus]MEB9896485.1 hypothetical protein [Bacillus cereus]GIO82356.1 hypothetical protein J6TS7_59660 [Paenibacillus dendritiformis]CAH8721247.1 hypothetical protein HTL2_006263 [Paenibacillus melissococcoides]